MANTSSTIINNNPLGEGMLSSGIFEAPFTAGAFPTTPNFYEYNVSSNSSDKIVLTLQKIKDSLKQQIAQENGANAADTSDSLVEQFLIEFTSLLIDYRDLRNYVFFGSAYTELAYNIKFIVDNYPYKFLISTLTTSLNTPSSEYTITNDVANNQTIIFFNQSAIKDGIEEFNFYDNNLDFNWLDYDLIDANNARYAVKQIETPYDNNNQTIFTITDLSSYAVTPVIGTPYSTLKVTTNIAHSYLAGQTINIFENILQNSTTLKQDENINDNYIISQIISSTEFLIVSKYAFNQIIAGDFDLFLEAVSIPSGYTIIQNGRVRLIPLSLNTQPYSIKLIVDGNFTEGQLLTYEDINSNGFSGFFLSKKQSILDDYYYNQTPIQKMLLSPSPINPTPWPRRQVTQNPEHLLNDSPYNSKELDFIDWLQSPTNSYVNPSPTRDDDISFSDTYGEYKLSRALSLDETDTNQLLRRCIPQDMVSEIYDTPTALFQRFILITGWFFDQIRVYVQFIKYVHHINYNSYNQLSPQYYKLYADYYGFDLFDDDNIDFSKLVVQTEPGFYFIPATDTTDANNKYYKLTLQQLQYEREKRLLLSLFYLYRSKGTSETIKKLISLLGAPDGFLLFNEFSFNIENTDQFDYYGSTDANNKFSLLGKRTVINDKTFVPDFHFEKDPDYPVTGNMPPVYRMRLHNESEYNLRSVSIATNPNGAVDSQIINVFGNQLYNYVKFQNGEFATLENLKSDFTINNPYYLLPLTIPDKFRSISVEYMIPRNGYTKGVANNLDESTIHLCSLFQIPNEIVNNTINTVYTYLLPEVYSNFDYASIRDNSSDTVPKTDDRPNVESDFDILNRYFNFPTAFNFTNPYIICRIEGNDLVVRSKINKETSSGIFDIGERVAIMPNIFEADGLNHLIKIEFRPEGIEVYEDYSHLGLNTQGKIGIALWQDPTTSPDGIPYCAFEIPKAKIFNLQYAPYDSSIFIGYPDNISGFDKPKYWDIFVGFPSNLDLYFKRIEISEDYSIDSFDIPDRIVNSKNYTAEYYSFDFSNNAGDNINFSIRAQFSQLEPNIVPADYSYILPVEEFNSKIVIKNLALTPKTLIFNASSQSLQSIKYFNQKQDFFNVEDTFLENGWVKNLHKQYYYSFFQKVSNLYQLYSPQVLTYDLLTDFLNLIEGKFKNTITNFIPIVIDISEFGRLIANSIYNQPKVHYPNIEKFCTGTIIGQNGILQERIYDISTGIQQGEDLILHFINQDSSNFINTITITWQGTVDLTLNKILNTIRSTSSNPYTSNMSVSLSNGLLAITVKTQWYNTTFGMDVNQLSFVVDDGTTTYTKKFQYGTLNTDTPSCGSIEYRLPNRKTSDVFVYYNSENQPPRYIYYASEDNPNKTYLTYGS